MELPKIDVPIYELTLPTTNKKVKYRPFTVKEEKLLLMAQRGDDLDEILMRIKQIVTNCCISKVNVDKMAMVDVEWIFLQSRIKSLGETTKLQFEPRIDAITAKELEEAGEKVCEGCSKVKEIEIDLTQIQATKGERHNKKIQINAEIGVVMRYPDMKMLEKFPENINEEDKILELIIRCTDSVYDSDTVYPSKEVGNKKLREFLEGLTQGQFEKIQHFFESMPVIKHDIDVSCPYCGHSESFTVEGIRHFFG